MTRSFRGIRTVRFGDFELDLRAAELRKHGIRVRLQEQPFRILVMLLERPGEVVLREEIRRRLWPNDTVVEVGHGINAAVLRLREALGESAEHPRFIETLARRGYRFTGEPEVLLKDAAREASTPPSAAPPLPVASAVDTAGLTGRDIAHFRVLDHLGGGGMGVVYRAEDLHLGRHVALKFLPPDLAAEPEALGRFQREARAASALNHPNICTIHAVEEFSGQPFIVMELLEGETLEATLARGPLSPEKAVPLAVQIAAALDAAHRKDIIHRDLKPANILLTRAGVKILDFGLAKMPRPAAALARPDSHLTREGAILGTLHYMSPEQVQGKDAGPRSDIFSFGLVLYEMLTARRAFTGDNPAAVMAAILTAQPPLSGIAEVLHPLLRRCLAKDPEDRWHSAGDLKAALEWIAEGWRPSAAPPAATAPPIPRRLWVAAGIATSVIAAALLLGSLSPAGVSWTLHPRAAAPIIPASLPGPGSRLTLAAPDGRPILKIALAPNGRTLAFTTANQLYLRALDSLETRSVMELSGPGTPFWAPDGQSLAIATGGKLHVVSPTGGSRRTVMEVNTSLAGAWTPDGALLIGAIGDGIFRVHPSTLSPTRLTTVDAARSESRHLLPQVLPDGKRFLYVAGSATPGASALYVGSLDSPERTRIMPVNSTVAYAQPRNTGSGFLLFTRDHVLMAQAFDPARLRTTVEAFSIAGPIAVAPAMGAAVDIADFSVAGSVLAYRTMNSRPAGPGPAAVKNDANVVVLRNWLDAAPR